MKREALIGIVMACMVLAPLIQAATSAKTAFVFTVPTTRSVSLTYGGSCSSTAFFFNEVDANFDPDLDGNAAKVKPSSTRGLFDLISVDRNFLGGIAPADINIAYGGFPTEAPPTTSTTPSTEVSTANYTSIGADDTSYYTLATTVAGRMPSLRMVFRTNIVAQRINDLNIMYMGDSLTSGTDCEAEAGTDSDLNMYIWNFATGSYQSLDTDAGGGGSQVGIATRRLEGIVRADINEVISNDGNIVVITQGVAIGTDVESCIFTDFVNLKITYIPVSTTFCQSSTFAPMILTNNGNVDVNVDGNFSSAFTGSDTNLVLKAWMGNGVGCGADGNGLGGWERNCTVTSITSPVTATTCKNFNETNATIASRLVTKLLTGDTNQLCFSGDFNGVGAGDHNKNFQIGSDYS